jgi:hypothetical protein
MRGAESGRRDDRREECISGGRTLSLSKAHRGRRCSALQTHLNMAFFWGASGIPWDNPGRTLIWNFTHGSTKGFIGNA